MGLVGGLSRVEGMMEFEVTSAADVGDVRIHRRVTSRRQLKMTVMPFADVFTEVTGSEFGSMVHLNPIEIGRSVETWRGPIPPGGRPVAEEAGP